jgi:hypothetical protein
VKKVAVIAAAGWKGGGSNKLGFPDCPEPLLPLPNGETIVSRLAKQLKRFGFEIVIGAGQPGCTFQSFEKFCPGCVVGDVLTTELAESGLSLDDSPWTEGRIEYLESLGKVVLMPNPGIGNCHDTYCRIIDVALGTWDRLLLLHGDMLFTDKFLTDIFALPWPCQFSMHPVHTMFLLTPNILPAYRQFAQGHRSGWNTFKEKQVMAMGWPGGVRGVNVLSGLGLPTYSMGHIGRPNLEIEWLDVDEPHKYVEAKRRIAAGEM